MLTCLLFLAIDAHPMPRLPVHFEPNQGQVAGETEWTASARGGTVFITGGAIAFATAKPGPKPRIMRFVGARKDAKGEGEGPTGGYSNYFHGRDGKNWQTGIPHYSKVRYRDLYPGIDLVYYGAPGRKIEFDIEVEAGADPSRVRMRFEGFDTVAVAADGGLDLGVVRLHRPKVQQAGEEIPSEYELGEDSSVRLRLAEHDPSVSLTVDPVLEFSTFLGGPGNEFLNCVWVDASGVIYLSGSTESPANPNLNPFQQPNLVRTSPLILKLSSDAQRILLFTTLTSSGSSSARSLAVDTSGNMILYGGTVSPDFPLKNPIRSEFRASSFSLFLAKLTPDGRSLVYSTYFGGSGTENGFQVRVDAGGDAYITGHTTSNDIPILNAFQGQKPGGYNCFLARVNPAGQLRFSTYFGGSNIEFCYAITLANESIYIAGSTRSPDVPLQGSERTPLGLLETPLIARFSLDGRALLGSAMLGVGNGGVVSQIAASPTGGDIYIAGTSYGNSLSFKEGYQTFCGASSCGYVMKLPADLRQIQAGTYMGGSAGSALNKIALGSDGTVYVGGRTSSEDFPTLHTLQAFRGGGIFNQDGVVARLSADLKTLVYSTFVGSSRVDNVGDIALDSSDRLYLVGWTEGNQVNDLPVLNAIQPASSGGYEGYMLRISDTKPIAAKAITASPGVLRWTYVPGGPPPAPQRVDLTGEPIAFSTAASAAWLTIVPRTGTVPQSLQARVALLGPGSYSADVVVTPASGDPTVIPVTLTVLAPAPLLTAVDPTLVPIGSDDTVVTFGGDGFTPQSKLRLYDADYPIAPEFVDARTLRLKMPWQSFVEAASYRFSVVNPGSDISQPVIVSVGQLSPSIVSAVNAASGVQGPVARGELVALAGANFGPLEGLKVTVSGYPAAIVSAAGNQIAVVVPDAVQGSVASLVVTSGALVSTPLILPLAESAPGLFTADGSGEALIDGTPSPGSTITLFGTGDGGLPVAVWIDGKECLVESSGVVEGKPGWFQVRVVIPADASVEVPVAVVLKAGDRESQPGVTLILR